MKQETLSRNKQTALLSHKDSDSITASIQCHLSTIELIGKQTANGEPLFKSKKAKKAGKLVDKLHNDYCDVGWGRNTFNWNDFFANVEAFKCLVAQQKAIISKATQIFAEEYQQCSYYQLKTIFSAENMIDDVLTAFDTLEWIYRQELPTRQEVA